MSNTVPSFADSVFQRDIDRFLISALMRASDSCRYGQAENSSEYLEKADRLIKAGANINAVGVDNTDPQFKRRLASAFVRENYSEFDGTSARQVLDFLFTHGFDPTLDNGRAGAELLISVLRCYDDRSAETLPDTLRYLLERGCRSDIRLPFLIDKDPNEEADWDLEKHLGELWISFEIGACNFLALKYIMTCYAILNDHRVGQPTDGITPMTDACGKPFCGLLVPPDADVRRVDADTVEIRLTPGFDRPTVGLALGDTVLALDRDHNLYCNRRQDDFVPYPFFADCQGECIRRITLTRHEEADFIVGMDGSQNLLIVKEQRNETDGEAVTVVRLKRVTDTYDYVREKLVFTQTSCSF